MIDKTLDFIGFVNAYEQLCKQYRLGIGLLNWENYHYIFELEPLDGMRSELRNGIANLRKQAEQWERSKHAQSKAQ